MNHLAKHGPLVSPNNEALRSLQDARPLYFLPQDPLTEEVVSGGAKVGQWSGGVVLARGGVITGHWLG
jgi:hypothetical protein